MVEKNYTNFRNKNSDFKPQSVTDDDWTNSQCDYQSDIFKEQLSCEILSQFEDQSEQQNLDFAQEEGIFHPSYNPSPQIEAPQFNKMRTNSYFQGTYMQMREFKNQNCHVQSQQKIMDKRTAQQNNILSCKKLSLNQSGIQQTHPNSKSNITTVQSTKHQRKPFNSLVPEKINKNAKLEVESDYQPEQEQTQVLNFGNKGLKNVLFCEETEQLSMQGRTKNENQFGATQQSSIIQLTPQKTLPVPISPTQRPILSNVSSVTNNQIQQEAHAQQLPMQKSESKTHGGNKSSGSKTNVVYDEFKYYTQANNYRNMIKMIYNNGGSGSFTQYKYYDSGQQFYEGVNSEGQAFDMTSPKLLVSPETNKQKYNSGNKSSNNSVAVKKQPFAFVGGSQLQLSEQGNVNFIQRNNSVVAKQDYYHQLSQSERLKMNDQKSDIRSVLIEEEGSPEQLAQSVNERGRGFENLYDNKIKHLQDQVEILEKELKRSQEKNFEMQRKFKEKGVLQSFERGKQQERVSLKHLSDTEDSLILSEKKKNRNSIVNKGGISQSQSSILDVKIKSIANLKQNVTLNSEKNEHVFNTSKKQSGILEDHGSKEKKSQNQEDDDYLEDTADNQLQYQVQSYRDQLTSEENQECTEFYYNSSAKDGEEQQVPSQEQENDSADSQECESCERLKQLVFQAKEAIDDLKLEIEEWREISANKETELRALQHKLYNDLIGIEKNVDFDDNVQTKEFDQCKPVNADANKIKNFIMHNKKKIRSRSKNAQCSNKSNGMRQSSGSKQQQVNPAKKKSALKKVQEIMSDEDIEFYQAEDQCVQTSFTSGTGGDKDKQLEIQFSQENVDQLDTPKYLITNEFPCKSRHNSIHTGLKFESCKKQQHSQSKENNNSNLANDHSQIVTTQQESIEQLKTQNSNYEQEITKLRSQLEHFSKSCDTLATLLTRVKRKNKQNKKNIIPNLEEIKQNCQIMSQLESYSILEKINEWKKEEGLKSGYSKLPPCRIPRPIKLIQEIDQNELDQIRDSLLLTDKNDLNSIIKREKLQLQQLQDQKYQELIKCQNDYVKQQMRNQMVTSKEFSTSSVTKQQDTVIAAVDNYIKKELN